MTNAGSKTFTETLALGAFPNEVMRSPTLDIRSGCARRRAVKRLSL
jgi:hypothetical protein